MKEKKKKEEDISSEIPKGKKPPKGGRLSDMIESMQKRGSPLNAHRVATRYFDSFRKERNIPDGAEEDEPPAAALPTTGKHQESEKFTAVDSAVIIKEKKKSPASQTGSKPVDLKDLDESFTPSESRVYGAMYKKSVEKKAPTLRFGLKELKELTGLSDKTVRVAIHSLEKKLSLRVAEPSLGVYGRKFYVPAPDEVFKERRKAGLEIDPTTKKVTGMMPTVITAVDNVIDTAITIPVSTAVTTGVVAGQEPSKEFAADPLALYELYTGKKLGEMDRAYFESIEHMDARVIEAALILTILKGKGDPIELSHIGEVLADLRDEIPEGYIEHLREAWKAFRG
ncbi:MAG TPA: hypothetical protein VHC46_02405 [Thermodesulfobacteriota bacterium]|nr:hypothetical protein [Thermodesulfobacteriota bacterium]